MTQTVGDKYCHERGTGRVVVRMSGDYHHIISSREHSLYTIFLDIEIIMIRGGTAHPIFLLEQLLHLPVYK